MSDLRTIEVCHSLTTLFGDVAESTSKLVTQEAKKIRDLTNDAQFWTKAAAISIGTCAVIGGVAGIGGAFVPAGSQIAGMSTDAIKTTLKVLSEAFPQIGNAGQTLAQGQASNIETEKSLSQNCTVQALQQKQNDANAKISSIAQAIQAALNAKSRNE